ncbi:MAG TPA: hypothetical protein VLD18_16580, partial [Verrucomicrobiae bacterium]|nr:hypothetical protein [Verrucomicrobiae bacterium]
MKPYLETWTNAPFAILQTELSPALLIRSQSSYLGLFQNMAATGLGGPHHLAFSTPGGPRPFKKGDKLEGNQMEENWILVWFDGAEGWTNWDSPWAVFLQHKPMAMKLDDGGLEFQFREPAGDVVMMPLYGYYKPPAATNDFLRAHGLPSKKIKTWEWSDFLPRDPLLRVRLWAAATRALPVYCEDSFSVDRSRDTVTLRQRFQRHWIEDDWGTKPLRIAPLSPVLGLAARDKQFPVAFNGEVFDFEYLTPYGPYLGVLNAEA